MSLASRLTALSAASAAVAIASTITPDIPSQLLAGFMGGWAVQMGHLLTSPDDDQDAQQ